VRFAAPVPVLKDALTLAFSAVPSRATIPSLASVLCVADGGGLTLTGSNAEWAVTVACEATVAEPGSCLLPTRFLAALREYGETVAVEVTATEIVSYLVKGSTRDKFVYAVEDPDGYPAPGDPPDTPTLTLPASTLRQALERTAFAASRDEGKYAMRGILWDGGALVATDGKRLAVADLGVKSPTPALLPPDAMGFVGRLCDSGDVRVSLLENAAFFQTDHGTVYTRLVEGRFPPYREVIPKAAKVRVPIESAQFSAAVRQARLMADAESCRIKLDFTAGKVVLTAQGATTGKANVTMPLGYDGPAMSISFDPVFLLEFLRSVGDVPVVLEMVDGEKSAVFRGDGFLHLVVPLV
jgi:DNA polymerase-3 subunit beta